MPASSVHLLDPPKTRVLHIDKHGMWLPVHRLVLVNLVSGQDSFGNLRPTFKY